MALESLPFELTCKGGQIHTGVKCKYAYTYRSIHPPTHPPIHPSATPTVGYEAGAQRLPDLRSLISGGFKDLLMAACGLGDVWKGSSYLP